MPNGIYLTLEQYKDKDLPLTITVNGNTYHSQFALATAQNSYFEMGKQHGMELGSDKTYSDMEMQWMHDQWYNEGYADGYKQGKQAGISKINLNTEPVEQTELSKEYDKGFTKGYEEGKEEEFDRGWAYGYDAGKEEGYEAGKKEATLERVDQFNKGYEIGKYEGYEEGKKANGISKKEIPGEYLSHIEEAYDDGYKEGYTDCREVAKMLNKYGIDEDGPEQTEYAKGYEDGRMDIMQFIGNNRG